MTPTAQPVTQTRALHAIALFEAVKGMAAIVASLGLLSLAHHDVRAMAYALIGHFHLDPDAHYPRMLLNDATLLANANLRQAVLLAWGYAAIRLTEGYGLWKDRAWAEWLAAASGAVYLPLELSHLMHHTTVINAMVLMGNLAVVAYMVVRLLRRRGQNKKLLALPD
jgi:uncharacterized membrane protein (DUF2068 family)